MRNGSADLAPMHDLALRSRLPHSFQLGTPQAVDKGILRMDNDGQAVEGDRQFKIVDAMGFAQVDFCGIDRA